MERLHVHEEVDKIDERPGINIWRKAANQASQIRTTFKMRFAFLSLILILALTSHNAEAQICCVHCDAESKRFYLSPRGYVGQEGLLARDEAVDCCCASNNCRTCFVRQLRDVYTKYRCLLRMN